MRGRMTAKEFLQNRLSAGWTEFESVNFYEEDLAVWASCWKDDSLWMFHTSLESLEELQQLHVVTCSARVRSQWHASDGGLTLYHSS